MDNPAPLMTPLLMWNEIVGFLLPLGIAFIMQEPWSTRLRAILSFVLYILAALGVCYFQHVLSVTTLDAVITSCLLVMITAIASYKGLWQPTNIAPSIEHATSGKHTEEFHQEMELRAA